MARPGVTTDEIDVMVIAQFGQLQSYSKVREMVFEAGAYPSPLNYR